MQHHSTLLPVMHFRTEYVMSTNSNGLIILQLYIYFVLYISITL